jgi:zinc transporter, ZIP family
MIIAIFWSALATGTLLIGMTLAYRNLVGLKWTGLIMAFSAGAIISAVAYQLIVVAFADEQGSYFLVGLGIAADALTFYFADKWIDHLGGANRKDFEGGQLSRSGLGIVLGSLLDGVPESLVLELSLVNSPQYRFTSSLQSQLAIFLKVWVTLRVCLKVGGNNPGSPGYRWQFAV